MFTEQIIRELLLSVVGILIILLLLKKFLRFIFKKYFQNRKINKIIRLEEKKQELRNILIQIAQEKTKLNKMKLELILEKQNIEIEKHKLQKRYNKLKA